MDRSLSNVELVALRDLVGTGYTVGPGERFKTTPEVAESLMSRGLAEPYVVRPVTDRKAYQAFFNKMASPIENKGAK